MGRLHQPAESISLAVRLLCLGWSKSQLFLWQHALVKPSPYGWGAEAILLLFWFLLGMGGSPTGGGPLSVEWMCVCAHMCLVFERKFDLFFLIESRKCEICQRPLIVVAELSRKTNGVAVMVTLKSTSTTSIMLLFMNLNSSEDLHFKNNDRLTAICIKTLLHPALGQSGGSFLFEMTDFN